MAEGLPEADFGKPGDSLGFSSNRGFLFTIGIFFAGLFLLALGAGLLFFNSQDSEDDIVIVSGSSQDSEGMIVVHVDGSVLSPGVYELGFDSRVGDAIAAAGGLGEDADSAKVNLAAKVSDGQKIVVPSVGGSQSQSGGQVSGASGLISINSASETELDTLPGIGPVTAKKIIASRPYSGLEDLLNKKAVNTSTYEKIKDLITF